MSKLGNRYLRKLLSGCSCRFVPSQAVTVATANKLAPYRLRTYAQRTTLCAGHAGITEYRQRPRTGIEGDDDVMGTDEDRS